MCVSTYLPVCVSPSRFGTMGSVRIDTTRGHPGCLGQPQNWRLSLLLLLVSWCCWCCCWCRCCCWCGAALRLDREGRHITTACMCLVHQGCRTRHITVGGADDDLRNALAIASDGGHRGHSRVLSVASRAGVSLKAQDKCGLGHLRLATDGPGPGERQGRRGGELRGWGVGLCIRVAMRPGAGQKALFAAIAQSCGREGRHITIGSDEINEDWVIVPLTGNHRVGDEKAAAAQFDIKMRV